MFRDMIGKSSEGLGFVAADVTVVFMFIGALVGWLFVLLCCEDVLVGWIGWFVIYERRVCGSSEMVAQWHWAF